MALTQPERNTMERLILTQVWGDGYSCSGEDQIPVLAQSKDDLLLALLAAATTRFEEKNRLTPKIQASADALQSRRAAARRALDKPSSKSAVPALLESLHAAEVAHTGLVAELESSRWFELGEATLELDDFIRPVGATFEFCPPTVQTIEEFFKDAAEVSAPNIP
jgi:hypothetical protein